jgi:NAD(P)-dependent dehydrogenase (short-subunit alcohol dehydrogenase family)
MSDIAVVVTGAAGALGRAVVAEFVGQRRKVIALDRAGEQLDALGEDAADRVVIPFEVDLADRAAVTAVWRRIDEVAAPSAMVAVAGGFVGGQLADLEPGMLETMLQSNLVATLWSCQAAAPRLAAVGGGSIVIVGSKAAVSGAAPIAYATSKAAVVRLTELLAEELRPAGVRVNAVLPSVIDTPANRSWMSEDLARRAVPTTAIAKVIAFLCSEDAWPISGAAIPVYGQS